MYRVEVTLVRLQGCVLGRLTKHISFPFGDRAGFKDRHTSQFQDSDGPYKERASIFLQMEQYGKVKSTAFGYHGARAWRDPKRDANSMNGTTERARKVRPLVTLLRPLGPAMPEVKSYH